MVHKSMKKKSKDGTSRCGKVTCKFWKVMRLQLLMIFVTLFQLHAENSYTQQKVSILFKDAAIEEVIKAVEAQSGYVVVYNNTLLKTVKRVTVTLRNVNAVEALNEALKGSGLHCKLVEDFLVIAKDNVKTVPEDDKGRKIEGKVTDKDKMPLPGVTVLVKGTKLGVVTDTAGKFQLTLPLEKEVTLQFSFIGMKAQEVKIKDYKPLSIVLEEEATEVEEVVVNGIFQRKAGSFTGSALTMKGEDLKRVSNSNVFASLKNLDPSLMIFDNLEFGSDPNKMPTMALRGKTAFDLGSDDIDLKGSYANDPNAPLFILDGFEASVQKIADLDMNRVESLTILKDASAKAIYGSKAANGVIVIETKKNTESSLRISYSGSVEIQAPDLSSYNLTNAAEKLEIEKDAGLYYDKNLSTLFNLQKDYNKKLAAVVSGIDTDFIRSVFHRGDRHLIIEMNVCNQRNGNLLSDLRNRFRSFQRRYGAADNFTANLFQSVNLRNRRRHILGRRVGHRLNQDRIAASDYTVSNFYDFGMISVHNALRFIASAFFLFKSPVIFILTLPHRQCNRFPANEFCCPTCRLLPKMPSRYSCASPEMHPV